jgi:TIR domain
MAGRIFDQLVARYGKASVFMDIDDIPPGMDFRAHIKEVLFRSDVLIVVIGNKWTGPQENRPARIFERKDPIRVEVLTALNRDMMVLPVLVDGAKMPEEKHIPRAIKNLAYLNAITIDAGKDFHPHIDRLFELSTARHRRRANPRVALVQMPASAKPPRRQMTRSS